MKRLTALMALSVLIGCATQQGFEDLAGQYLNMSEGELVERLGSPSNAYETENAKYLTWARSVVQNPSYTTNVVGSTVITTPIGGGEIRCAVTYKLEEREIIDLTTEAEQTDSAFISTSYRYEGNGCRA